MPNEKIHEKIPSYPTDRGRFDTLVNPCTDSITSRIVPSEDGIGTFKPLVQTLVTEILAEIFLFCVESSGFAQLTISEAPLNVSHVCRRWRDIALSTRGLWTSVHLACSDDDTTIHRLSPALTEWIRRSGDMDLHIRVQCLKVFGRAHAFLSFPGDACDTNVGWMPIEGLLEEIARHSPRLKSMALVMPDKYSVPALKIVADLCTSINNLTLQFYFTRGASRRPRLDYQVSNMFGNLISLRIDGNCSFEIGDPMPQLPKLEYLALNFEMDSKLLCIILEKCPSLQELHINMRYVNLYPVRMTMLLRPVTTKFSTLHTFRFSNFSFFSPLAENIWKTLQLPQLRQLAVEPEEHSLSLMPTEWSSVPQFLEFSSPLLDTLVLGNVSRNSEETLHCLRLLPSLKHVQLSLTEIVANALIITDHVQASNTIICPLLETMSFHISELEDTKSFALWISAAKMIKSRCRSPVAEEQANAGQHSELTYTSSELAGGVPERKLREVSWASPDISNHPLFKCVQNLVREGLIVIKSE